MAVDDTAATDEDTPVNIPVLANDSDIDSPNLPVRDAVAAHGTVVIEADGTITYTPEANFNGIDSIIYTVADGPVGDTGAKTDTATVTVTVNPVNDAPMASPIDAGMTNEDAAPATIDLLATASDVDTGDTLSAQNITATDDVGAMVAFTDNLDGTLEIDPAQYNTLKVGESRTVTVSYEVFDGTDATTNTATLVVEGRNDAPIADDQSFSVAEESAAGTVVGTILATDIEGEAIRFIVDPADTGPFSVDVNTGEVTLAQDIDDAEVGDYTFTVDVLDRSGGITPITITATVTPVNDPPVIADQSFSVAEESPEGRLSVRSRRPTSMIPA